MTTTTPPTPPTPDAPDAPDTPDATGALPPVRRRRGAGLLRAFTGLVVVALAGGAAYGVDLLPREDAEGAEGAAVAVVPASVDVVCPAPAQLADPDATTDPAFDPTPVGTTTSVAGLVLGPATTPAEPVRALDGTPVAATATGSAPRTLRALVSSATSVRATPSAEGAADLAAAVVSTTTAGDLRGLAGASCQVPAAEQWLLGGSTNLGSSTRLVVQNPTRTAASVDVELWGPGGRVEAAGPTTMTVPAGGQAARLLESVAPEQRLLAVRVVARGALVASYLQVGGLDGLRPTGVDLAVATAPPAVRQVVPGIAVDGGSTGARLDVLVPEAQPAELADAAPPAELDAAPPADADAADPVAVTVTVLGAEGRVVVPGSETLDVVPGRVTSLDLAALGAGSYTLVLDAAEPLVAAVTTARTGAEGTDTALVAAQGPAPTEAGAGPALVAVPAGARGSLVLAVVPDDLAAVPGAVVGTGSPVDDEGRVLAPGRAAATVEVVDAAGRVVATRSVDVPVGGTAAVPLADLAPGADVAGVVVRGVSDGGRLVWALGLAADARDGTTGGLVTVLAPAASAGAASEVVVRPGPVS